MRDTIRIILVNPSHPGNVGSAARAMKNMGLQELYLVNPQMFPSEKATALASGADDILTSAAVTDDLPSALKDCHLVFGTSARLRTLEKPTVTPREAASAILRSPLKTAILFGRESTGLTNDELSLCHQHIVIPTAQSYSSLNLAAAVQIIAYECYLASLSAEVMQPAEVALEPASADQVAGFYQHLQTVLEAIKFLDPKQPKMLMQRLRRLFNRTRLDKTELNILRGILSRVERLTEQININRKWRNR